MKLLEKIKKGLMGIGGFLLMIPTKVLAMPVDDAMIQTYLYGPPKEPPKPSLIEIIWNIARNLIFPVVLLMGIIIYFKKSKSSKKKKLLVTLGIIVLVALLYFFINKIVINLNLL